MDDAQLRTIWQQRQSYTRTAPVSESLGILMKHRLGRRVKRFGELAVLWDDVIPVAIRDHTALDGFCRGVLTVLVDSASHRFQLQTLLKGGVSQVMQRRFSGALNRIRLVPGQFYSIDQETGTKRYEV